MRDYGIARCPVCTQDVLVVDVGTGGSASEPWRLTEFACGDWLSERWVRQRGGAWGYQRTGGGKNDKPCLPSPCPPLEGP